MVPWPAVMVLIVLFFLAGCGGNEAAGSNEPAGSPQATHDPQIAQGKTLFSRHCAACHAIEPDAVIVGPSLHGIAAQAGDRVPGLDASQYIQQSILQPDAYLVEGFDNLMPSTLGKQLTGEELDALTSYLLTLDS